MKTKGISVSRFMRTRFNASSCYYPAQDAAQRIAEAEMQAARLGVGAWKAAQTMQKGFRGMEGK